MEKIELKHLAPYLPYGLKAITTKETYKDPQVGIIDYWSKNGNVENEISISSDEGYYLCQPHEIKPLLRPLSDLYKEIDGEIPADILFPKEYYSLIDFYEEYNRENQIQSFIKDGLNWCETYSFWEYLLSKHFDVFSLIDKGLAIDLNSISHE